MFANATIVRNAPSGDVRSRLNSSVLPSGRVRRSDRFISLKSTLKSPDGARLQSRPSGERLHGSATGRHQGAVRRARSMRNWGTTRRRSKCASHPRQRGRPEHWNRRRLETVRPIWRSIDFYGATRCWIKRCKLLILLAERTGLEPATPGVTGRPSNLRFRQLNQRVTTCELCY